MIKIDIKETSDPGVFEYEVKIMGVSVKKGESK